MSTCFKCSLFSALFSSDAGTIILLPFVAIPQVITVLSLNEQYGCSSLHILAFVDGQPCNVYSDSIPKCSMSRVASLISSPVMQSGIYMHVSIAFMVIHITDISSSLFYGFVWISSLLWMVVVQVYTGFLCCVGECVTTFFAICVMFLLHHSWKLTSWVKQ